MAIQALLFDKKYFNVRQANAFLKRNNFEKIKSLHTTNKYIRARLMEPNYKKYIYRLGNITLGIDCIYQFNK